jgi:hypothetical protein
MLEIERGSTRSHCKENFFWKRLRSCRKRDYIMIMINKCKDGVVSQEAVCSVQLDKYAST